MSHLDGVLGKHAAVKLDGRQAQVLGDVSVLDLHDVVQGSPLDPLGGQAAARDGGAAAESLEARVDDVTVVVHLDLQLHHVAASRRSDQASADVLVVLVERPHVPWVLVVVDDLRSERGVKREKSTMETERERERVCVCARVR